jgi:hypothetical protein
MTGYPEPEVETFDLETVWAGAKGYSSALTDGRFLYLTPLFNGEFFGEVARFDSTRPFQDAGAWTFFDLQTLRTGARGFIGGDFDGRYLYLIPHCADDFHGLVARYDSTCAFTDPDAWTFFDTSQVNQNSRGYVGGAFDGGALYLSPYRHKVDAFSGLIARYKSKHSFLDGAAWEFFDATSLNPGLRGFHGAVAHRDELFFIPYTQENKGFHGNMLRYDSSRSFLDRASWDFVSLTDINPRARGFVGGVSSDAGLLLAPYFDGEDRSGLVTLGSGRPGQPLSHWEWQFVDLEQFHPMGRGYFGATKVGSRIFLIPHCLDGINYHGLLAQWDTRRSLSDETGWTFLDICGEDPLASGFMGATALADCIYLAPFENAPGQPHGRVARVKVL